jgi:pimeloyl-ACP methyl ester carboxylesterase
MASAKKHIFAIHGAGMHAGIWGSLANSLETPLQAISFPGHGKTEGTLLPSIEQMAAWAAARLAEHPPQSIVLLGHSMGALAALETARHPSVAALVLLGAAAKMPVHPELLHQAGADPAAAADMILKWGISAVNPQAAAIRTVLKGQMQAPAGVLLNDLTACNTYKNGEAAAQPITQPALVLAGLDDKLTKPAEGQALSDLLPRGEFHILPDSGHMLMVEKPLETAKEINAFIAALDD